MAQVDSNGIGPVYLLNGLSDKDYWYQVGLSYNWGTYIPGVPGYNHHIDFGFNYEVFDSTGKSIFPSDGGGGILSFSGMVNAGDTVRLTLYFGTGPYVGDVVMSAYDYNTSSYVSETYSAEGASQFVGNTNSESNAHGFFTGLMTEQYHSNPFYGNEQFVTYSDTVAKSSAWMWIDEFNTASNQPIFRHTSDSPVAFDSYYQLHELSSNGATEYADAYNFYTGMNPLSLSLSAVPIRVDAGMKTRAPFTASTLGGTAPYTYLVFLDNNLISNTTASRSPYSATLDIGSPSAGDHQYYVYVKDSKGYPASTQTTTFAVNPDPTLTIASNSAADQGQVVKISSQRLLGTPPYTTTLYINGAALPQTDTESVTMSQLGKNDVYVKLSDAAGFTVTSNTLSIAVSKDPVVSVTPNNSITDAGLPITYTESTVGGTSPYSVNWLVNGQPEPGSEPGFRFASNSSGTYSISAQITDGADYVVKSSSSTVTVNTDTMISTYMSTGKSTNFFLFNNTAQSSVDVSGGTAQYTYVWYLNGFEIAHTSEPSYAYAFSSMGANLLQVKVSDAAGYTVASETTKVNFGIDFPHIGIAVAVVIVALYLVISQLRKGRSSNMLQPEKKEPISAQPQVPSIVPQEKQEPVVQPKESTELAAPAQKKESTFTQPQATAIVTDSASPMKGDPLAILRLRYAKGEISKEEYEAVLALPASEDPVAIVKLRYAKGEITKEQYMEILRILRE